MRSSEKTSEVTLSRKIAAAVMAVLYIAASSPVKGQNKEQPFYIPLVNAKKDGSDIYPVKKEAASEWTTVRKRMFNFRSRKEINSDISRRKQTCPPFNAL